MTPAACSTSAAAPVVEAFAEQLPFEDDSFDAAMALITVHHWSDAQAGLAEMVRVARHRVLVLTFTVEPVPIPNRCTDGFWLAVWDRPEMHLDPDVRRASSSWHHMEQGEIDRGLEKLAADLESGRWDERNGHLRTQPELDIGLRLIKSEPH